MPALIRNMPILILDEGTLAVDMQTAIKLKRHNAHACNYKIRVPGYYRSGSLNESPQYP